MTDIPNTATPAPQKRPQAMIKLGGLVLKGPAATVVVAVISALIFLAIFYSRPTIRMLASAAIWIGMMVYWSASARNIRPVAKAGRCKIHAAPSASSEFCHPDAFCSCSRANPAIPCANHRRRCDRLRCAGRLGAILFVDEAIPRPLLEFRCGHHEGSSTGAFRTLSPGSPSFIHGDAWYVCWNSDRFGPVSRADRRGPGHRRILGENSGLRSARWAKRSARSMKTTNATRLH